jgi:hypothetical protein
MEIRAQGGGPPSGFAFELECDPNIYPYAAFRFVLFAKGERALPALISTHRLRAASAMAFRPAALNFRFGFAVALRSDSASLLRDPGGRPRRFPVVPPRASMARFSLSRSANRNARICSDIRSIVTQANTHKMTSKVATPVNIQGLEPGQIASFVVQGRATVCSLKDVGKAIQQSVLRVPIRMRRPFMALKAARLDPLVKARLADTARVERVPYVAACADPPVASRGSPTAERATDARAGGTELIFVAFLDVD